MVDGLVDEGGRSAVGAEVDAHRVHQDLLEIIRDRSGISHI